MVTKLQVHAYASRCTIEHKLPITGIVHVVGIGMRYEVIGMGMRSLVWVGVWYEY